MAGQVGEERGPVKWWLLSICCLIPGFMWIHKVWTEIKNFTGNEEINPTTKTIFMIIPILSIITMYNMYKEIAEMQGTVGIPEDDRLNPVVNLILSMVVAGIGIIFAQKALNAIWEKAGAGAAAPGMM